MKKTVFLFCMGILFSSPVFAESDEAITAKALVDEAFLSSVKSDIKSEFKKPETVVLDFFTAGAETVSPGDFKVRFQYFVTVGSTEFGLCTFVYGAKHGENLNFVIQKKLYQDC